jgi:hypothetical protein
MARPPANQARDNAVRRLQRQSCGRDMAPADNQPPSTAHRIAFVAASKNIAMPDSYAIEIPRTGNAKDCGKVPVAKNFSRALSCDHSRLNATSVPGETGDRGWRSQPLGCGLIFGRPKPQPLLVPTLLSLQTCSRRNAHHEARRQLMLWLARVHVVGHE